MKQGLRQEPEECVGHESAAALRAGGDEEVGSEDGTQQDGSSGA